MSIIFKDGNILNSKTDIIAHQVNCIGVMGAGLAKQIRIQYPKVYSEYFSLCEQYKIDRKLLLGTIQFVGVGERIIANCFAQWGYGVGVRQTQYDAFRGCLETLKSAAPEEKYKSIAIPYKMGCGLAGGDWDNIIYPMIQEIFEDSDIILEVWRFNN